MSRLAASRSTFVATRTLAVSARVEEKPVSLEAFSSTFRRTRLYSPFKTSKALEPPRSPLHVDWTAADAERDPQLAGLSYPKFEGDIWRYSRHLRKGGYPWDDAVQKRNRGELLHPDDNLLWVYGPEVHAEIRMRSILIGQAVFFGSMAAIALVVYVMFEGSPLAPKEVPHGGLQSEIREQSTAGDGQYTFDSAEEDE